MVKEDKLDLVPVDGDQTPDGNRTLETPSFKRGLFMSPNFISTCTLEYCTRGLVVGTQT
jgi:hypothetical protein